MYKLFVVCLIGGIAFAQQPATKAPSTWPPAEPGLYGVMTTSMGVIRFKLHENEAPNTVRNFVQLAQGRKEWTNPGGQKVRTPLYNGVTFHRVIPGFMIQAGDPTGTGMGDVGFTIRDEIHPSLKFDKPGVFGMAKTSAPHSGSSQFFITEDAKPYLDGTYPVFGQVLEGQSVVTAIARVPRDANDKPTSPVRITRIDFQRVGPRPATAPEAPPAVTKKSGAAPATKSAAPATKSAAPATKSTAPAAKKTTTTKAPATTPKKQ